MNSFDEASKVEHLCKARLAPWLTVVSHEGRWIWNANSRLARFLQTRAGDLMISTGAFESAVIEVKALFNSHDAPFEIWSNLIELPDGRPNRELSKPGWGQTCQADLIIVYTIATDTGVIGSPTRWRDYMGEKLPNGLRRWQLRQKVVQSKYPQLNRTQLVWCSHAELIRNVGFVAFSARQLELFERNNPIQEAST